MQQISGSDTEYKLLYYDDLHFIENLQSDTASHETIKESNLENAALWYLNNGLVESNSQGYHLNANGDRLLRQLKDFKAGNRCMPSRMRVDTSNRNIELMSFKHIEVLILEQLRMMGPAARESRIKDRIDLDPGQINTAFDDLFEQGYFTQIGDVCSLNPHGYFALYCCIAKEFRLDTVERPVSSSRNGNQDDNDSPEIIAETSRNSHDGTFASSPNAIPDRMGNLSSDTINDNIPENIPQIDETRYSPTRFHREHRLLEALSQYGGQKESQADYLAEQIWYSSNLAVPHFSPEYLSYNSVDRFSGPNFDLSPYSVTPFQNKERAAFRRRFRKTRRRDYLAALQGFIDIVYHKIRKLLRSYPNLRQEFIDGNGGSLFPRNIPGYDIPFGPGSKKNQLMKSAISAYRSFRRYSELVETAKTRQ